MNIKILENKYLSRISEFIFMIGKSVFVTTIFSFLIRIFEFYYTQEVKKVNFSSSAFIESSVYFDFLNNVILSSIWAFLIIVFGLHKKTFFRKIVFTSLLLFSITLLILNSSLLFFGQIIGNQIFIYSTSELIHTIFTLLNWQNSLIVISVLLVLIGLWHLISKLNIDSKKYYSIPFYIIGVVSLIYFIGNYKAIAKTKNINYFQNRQEYEICNSKLSYFIESLVDFQQNQNFDLKREFPFYKDIPETSSISNFFKKGYKPNIYIIIDESLSASFSGESHYLDRSYTPFLDSLAKFSLYWKNNLSTSERTYGVLPAILNSSIYGGKAGFIRILKEQNHLPKGTSLIEELNLNGYLTRFFYGGYSPFDNMKDFMINQNIDQIHDEENMKKFYSMDRNCSWGISDSLVFEYVKHHTLTENYPSLNIILTTGIHEPFDQCVPDYQNLKTKYHKKTIGSILQNDKNFKDFFSKIANNQNFRNSIFIITGDHNIQDHLPLKNDLEVFHTPLIIYSPLLIEAKKFPSLVSHRDILPTLLGLIKQNYGLAINSKGSFLGNQLNTSPSFQTNFTAPLNLYNNNFCNLIDKDLILINDLVYRIVDEKLKLQKITDSNTLKKLQTLKEQMITQDQTALTFGLMP
jgi:uncharacterized sulfatase